MGLLVRSETVGHSLNHQNRSYQIIEGVSVHTTQLVILLICFCIIKWLHELCRGRDGTAYSKELTIQYWDNSHTV